MRKKVVRKTGVNLSDVQNKLNLLEDVNKLLADPDPDYGTPSITWRGSFQSVQLPDSWYDEVFNLIQTLAKQEKQKLVRQLNKHLKVKIKPELVKKES